MHPILTVSYRHGVVTLGDTFAPYALCIDLSWRSVGPSKAKGPGMSNDMAIVLILSAVIAFIYFLADGTCTSGSFCSPFSLERIIR